MTKKKDTRKVTCRHKVGAIINVRRAGMPIVPSTTNNNGHALPFIVFRRISG